MGLPLQISSAYITGSSAVIAASQTNSATALTLVTASGVSLDAQRRVLLTQNGTNSGIAYTITGTNQSGTTISETIISATASALTSSMDYKTVTAISLSAAATGTISAGTNGTGSTPWQAANNWIAPYNLLVNAALAGTATYSLELTLDRDPCGIRSNTALTAVSAFSNPNSTSMNAATTGTASFVITPISAWRITTTTGQGALTIQAIDAGVGVG